MEIRRIIRRGTRNSRVELANGENRLLPNTFIRNEGYGELLSDVGPFIAGPRNSSTRRRSTSTRTSTTAAQRTPFSPNGYKFGVEIEFLCPYANKELLANKLKRTFRK